MVLSRLPRWSCVGLAAADLPTGTPETVGMSAARLARIDAAMQADIAAGRLPGVVISVARRGKVVYEKAFGVANLQTREAMRTDAMFRLYSMTKAVASVGLLTLDEQGKFRLTDPLDRYLPQFANVKVYKGADAAASRSSRRRPASRRSRTPSGTRSAWPRASDRRRSMRCIARRD